MQFFDALVRTIANRFRSFIPLDDACLFQFREVSVIQPEKKPLGTYRPRLLWWWVLERDVFDEFVPRHDVILTVDQPRQYRSTLRFREYPQCCLGRNGLYGMCYGSTYFIVFLPSFGITPSFTHSITVQLLH